MTTKPVAYLYTRQIILRVTPVQGDRLRELVERSDLSQQEWIIKTLGLNTPKEELHPDAEIVHKGDVT